MGDTLSTIPPPSSNPGNAIRQVRDFLKGCGIWIVGGAVVASVIHPSFLPAAVIAAAGFFLLRRLTTRWRRVWTPADIPVLLLLIISIANLLWVTPQPDITRPQALRLWSGIGLYYAVIDWTTLSNLGQEKKITWLWRGMITIGLLLGLVAPISVDWATGKLAFIPTALYSRFIVMVQDGIHPNVLGGLLALLIPIAAAYALFSSEAHGWERAAAAIVAFFMAGMLVISESRGAIIGVTAALICLLILYGRWGWLALAAACVTGAIIMYHFGFTQVLNLALSGGAIGSLDERLEIWSRAVYMIQDFPFTGIGMGCFIPVVDRLYPLMSFSADHIPPHAHNLFLQIGVDLGIPGLLAWLAILVSSLLAAWRTYRAGKWMGNGLLMGLGAGLLCSQIALIVHGMTDAVTWGMVRPAPIVWFIWGLSMAAVKSMVTTRY